MEDKTIVTLRNVQCLDEAEIDIVHNAINIKYGYNGLGKSSIGKGIAYKLDPKANIEELTPFGSSKTPSVDLSTDKFTSCLCFNKEYLDNSVFKDDNAFDDETASRFYLSTTDIEKTKGDLLILIEKIKKMLETNSIQKYRSAAQPFADKFISDDGTINSHSNAFKGLNKSRNVASYFASDKDFVSLFSEYLNSETSFDWIDWRIKTLKDSSRFSLGDSCPYCGNKDFNKEKFDIYTQKLKDFGATMQSDAHKAIKSLMNLAKEEDKPFLNTLLKLDDTNKFDEEKKSKLQEITKYLRNEYNKIDILSSIEWIFDGKEETIINLKQTLEDCKFDLSIFKNVDDENVDSGDLVKSLQQINNSIDELINNFDSFKAKAMDYNKTINDSIEGSKTEVNNFLTVSGIPYIFNIEKDRESVTTFIASKNDSTKAVKDPAKHLSYGEHNSFALALFGALAKRAGPETLIILDDPISSYDENKKYAVLYFLFNPDTGVLKDKTVLMLTHDMEPVIDLFKQNLIKDINVNVSLLEKRVVSQDTDYTIEKGIERKQLTKVNDHPLTKKDIVPVAKSERNGAKNEDLNLYSRTIHLRRAVELGEIEGQTKSSLVYQVLSNSEKLINVPQWSDKRKFSDDELELAADIINRSLRKDGIPRNQNLASEEILYQYFSFVIKHQDVKYMMLLYENAKSNYEKITLLNGLEYAIQRDMKIADLVDKRTNRIVRNFLTDAFHIENMDLYTINEFDAVPPYIIKLCDELFDNYKESLKDIL